MGLFERSDTVFDDEDALTDSYEPEDLSERADEIEEYTTYLQPVIEGATPDNVFLYGKTGVGKTVVTKYLFDQLEADAKQYDDLAITTEYVNCEDASTSYQVAVRLVNKFRERTGDSRISPTGYPKRQVHQFLWEVMDDLGGTILVTLDEVDHLEKDASILYQLPRARANGNLSEAKVGVVGISNDFTFKDRLDPRILDTLAEKELHFPPYDAAQLRSILRERAEVAFKNGAVTDGAINLCAARAAKDKGSARQALDLLLYAGQRARKDDEEPVTDMHVEDAHSRLQREEIKRGMRDLTKHGKLALGSILVLRINNPDLHITRNDAYEQYTNLTDACGEDPLAAKSLHRHLSDLVMQGILTRNEINEGSKGGRRYVYELGVPLDDALTALEESIRDPNIGFEQLREPARIRGLID